VGSLSEEILVLIVISFDFLALDYWETSLNLVNDLTKMAFHGVLHGIDVLLELEEFLPEVLGTR
jgi:hypothetical protein